MTANRTYAEQEKYAIAGAIADETFSSMRTVQSMNGGRFEIERYEAALEDGRKTGLLKYMYMAIGLGSTFIITHASYAVAFWFASRLIVWDPSFDRGSVFTVFFAVMSGSTALGGALPHLTSVGSALGAARHVLKVINNKPRIDPYSTDGQMVNGKLRGAISFNNIHFAYPLRKDIKVLDGISFSVQPGQKIAFVGSSGCGKSTSINLLLRFYDPDQGTITLTEPVLFDGTLEENIMLGNEYATREDVNRCCKMANAYDFIQKLSDGLYTRVGERGAQLSGGQKQRIAIARALIRNPKILLLDEATSALDTESEAIVQQALDKAQEGRTTFIVAHRLATIRNVDQILVFKEGNIVERGTHDELYNLKGMFYEMVNNQQINNRKEEPLENIKENESSSENEDDIIDLERTRSSLSRKRSQVLSPGGRVHRRKTSSISSRKSTEAQEIFEMQREMEESEVKPSPIFKIFKMNRANWHFYFSACWDVFSADWSCPFLLWSMHKYSRCSVSRLSSCSETPSFGLLCFWWCGEALTKKLRLEAFTNLLRQHIAFYDDKRHNTGKLCTRFATDAPNVRYVFTRLPVVISSVVTLLGALAIGFFEGWKLAVVLVLIVPLILASGYFEMRQQKMRDTELLEEAGKIASEAVENIRTVHGLNKQMIFYKKYADQLEMPYRANMRQAQVYGAVFAFSQSLIFFMYALAFWIGSIFVLDGSMTPVSVFRVFFAIAFCGQSVGQLSAFIPDVVKARIAASLIFHLIEYPTLIDSLSDLGISMDIKGNIHFRNVHFSYPTRADVSILKGLDMSVRQGETLALVGYSGCGKSTIIALLERFYNPTAGHISIDGVNLRDFNIHQLRQQMCLVSQEPVLFGCSIAENICYGLDEGPAKKYRVSHEQIVHAAEQANIHNFVLGLPEGYDTKVGEKGTQLSGGQKQRIAIARALIRNPAILLLDEATSALDSESEKIVQDALEKARKGRTCIVIAHRLSTVQNADQIAVINDGKVVEKGTHDELLAQGGIYTGLCQTQILKDTNK
uniref:ABC-type xenobiotic transporter n=1 Tax=Ditylenchus dipsaci TaxID=166011 RepID=A0A915EIP5_9BILA